MRAALFLLLAGCSDPEQVIKHERSCGDWQSVGQPFALSWCASCHSSALGGDARKGAPEGLNFDTLAGVQSSSEAAAAAISAQTMPRGGGPTAAQRTRFLDWLACGAPGEDEPRPAGVHDTTLLQARETLVEVESEADLLVVWTSVVGGDADGRVGLWSAERYAIDGHRARLDSRALYDEEGAIVQSETWDPPLLVFTDDQESWRAETSLSWWGPDGSGDEDQSWEIAVSTPASLDSRNSDPAAWSIDATLADGDGPTTAMGWLLSDSLSLSGTNWTVNGVLEEHRQLTVAFPFDGLPAFPLAADTDWHGRLLRQEAP